MKLKTTNRCATCLKLRNETEILCSDCAELASKFKLMNKLYCHYRYDGIVKEMIQQYKFQRDVAIAEIIAEKLNCLITNMITLSPYRPLYLEIKKEHLTPYN